MNFTKARQALLQGRKNEVYQEIAGLNDPKDVDCLIALYHFDNKDKKHVTPILEALKRINSPDASEFLSLPEAEVKRNFICPIPILLSLRSFRMNWITWIKSWRNLDDVCTILTLASSQPIISSALLYCL